MKAAISDYSLVTETDSNASGGRIYGQEISGAGELLAVWPAGHSVPSIYSLQSEGRTTSLQSTQRQIMGDVNRLVLVSS